MEIDDNGQRNSEDSKVCGQRIKIGTEIGVKGVINAGVRFVFEKCENAACEHASGESGNASASGESGTATVTGRDGRASAIGEQCIAVAWGQNSLAKGTLGNWIVVSERGNSGDIVDAKLARVDGEIIKPDTWYTLRNGKIMEEE